MTNQGNGSRFFTLRQRRWVMMEEIALLLHVGGDQVALVTVEIGTASLSFFYFSCVCLWFWVRNRVEGEMSGEENEMK